MLNWAARLLQNNWRILRSKRKRKALIEANKKASQKKKERIEKLLKFLRMRNKRGGRLLVRLRITKESELPLDLVEEPLFSKEIRVRYDIMRRYIMRNKESDHALLERFVNKFNYACIYLFFPNIILLTLKKQIQILQEDEKSASWHASMASPQYFYSSILLLLEYHLLPRNSNRSKTKIYSLD